MESVTNSSSDSSSDASRRIIIRAVWALIASGGIESVTFRRVANHAQVSVGRIQYHFRTREALVRAACADIIDFANEGFQQLPEDPVVRLHHIVEHVVPDSQSTRLGTGVWYAYLAKSAEDPEIARLLAEAKRGTEVECARLIEQVKSNTIGETVAESSSEATRAARYVLALADGLTERVLIGDLSGAQAREELKSELQRIVATD